MQLEQDLCRALRREFRKKMQSVESRNHEQQFVSKAQWTKGKGNSEGRQVLTIHICLLIQYPLELCLNLESILLKKQNRFSSRLLYLKLCLSFQYKNIITNRRCMLFCLILTVSLQGSYQYPYFRKENMETLRIYINFQD